MIELRAELMALRVPRKKLRELAEVRETVRSSLSLEGEACERCGGKGGAYYNAFEGWELCTACDGTGENRLPLSENMEEGKANG